MTLDFGIIKSGLFPESDVSGQGMGADANSSIIWNDVGIGIVPIGGVVAWLKTLTGCPALLPNWVECNGQVLSDGESPFNTQTIPNLNGAVSAGLKGRFLRGNATSGDLEDSQNLQHNHSALHQASSQNSWGLGGGTLARSSGNTGNSGGSEARPYNYSVVWIMRIK
jgi:hypothetical protein